MTRWPAKELVGYLDRDVTSQLACYICYLTKAAKLVKLANLPKLAKLAEPAKLVHPAKLDQL